MLHAASVRMKFLKLFGTAVLGFLLICFAFSLARAYKWNLEWLAPCAQILGTLLFMMILPGPLGPIAGAILQFPFLVCQWFWEAFRNKSSSGSAARTDDQSSQQSSK